MEYYYHSSIKNYTVALLDLFNDISVPRYENGDRIKDLVVPIKFGTRENNYTISENDMKSLLSGNVRANIMPRMSLSLESMSKAPERNTNKLSRVVKNNKSNELVDFYYNASAYDFTFSLNIATKSLTDCLIIIEQIVTSFNPSVVLKINEIDELLEPTTVIVKISDPDIEIPEDLDDAQVRIITASIEVTLQGNLYPPTRSSSIIKEVEIKLNSTNTGADYGLDETLDTPGNELESVIKANENGTTITNGDIDG